MPIGRKACQVKMLKMGIFYEKLVKTIQHDDF